MQLSREEMKELHELLSSIQFLSPNMQSLLGRLAEGTDGDTSAIGKPVLFLPAILVNELLHLRVEESSNVTHATSEPRFDTNEQAQSQPLTVEEHTNTVLRSSSSSSTVPLQGEHIAQFDCEPFLLTKSQSLHTVREVQGDHLGPVVKSP